MIISRASLHRIGWAMILTVCSAILLALILKVNSVRSQVKLAERQIVAARAEKQLLETEFETRASQHQLVAINNVDFGYSAPTTGQYIESERSLAPLGKARAADAPSPIMVAAADEAQESVLPDMVNPLSGKAMAAEVPQGAPRKRATAASLSARLSEAEKPEVIGKGPHAKGAVRE
jgi:hypothetical protein